MSDFDTIRKNLSRFETDELRRIWIEHDEVEWRPEAFAAMASILQERGEPLPQYGGEIGARLREQRIERERDQKDCEIDRTRLRAGSPLAIWLGGVVALFGLFAIFFAANAVVPESQWPDINGNRALQLLALAVVLGIYGAFWRLSAFVIWRILAGSRNHERLNPQQRKV